MGSLSSLLRWKKTIELVDQNKKPILDADGKPKKVYMRIIGDQDLKEAYAEARVASSNKRAALRDPETNDYRMEVGIFEDASEEECVEAIRAAQAANWTQQAMSNVVRPDEVEIEAIAADPDAPTLEEQEKLDIANKEQDQKYLEEIQAYTLQKNKELEDTLSDMTLAQKRELAKGAMTNIQPLYMFMQTLTIEKVWRSCWDDPTFKIRSFDSAQDFKDTVDVIQKQLLEAYSNLEVEEDKVKN